MAKYELGGGMDIFHSLRRLLSWRLWLRAIFRGCKGEKERGSGLSPGNKGNAKFFILSYLPGQTRDENWGREAKKFKV